MMHAFRRLAKILRINPSKVAKQAYNLMLREGAGDFVVLWSDGRLSYESGYTLYGNDHDSSYGALRDEFGIFTWELPLPDQSYGFEEIRRDIYIGLWDYLWRSRHEPV